MNDMQPLQGPSDGDSIDLTPTDTHPAPEGTPQPDVPAPKASFDPALAERGFDPKSFSDDDDQYVDQAKSMGWTPPDSFKGNPEGYVGAKRFVERGRSSPAAVRRENKELQDQLATIQAQQERMIQQQEADRARIIKSSYDRALRDLQAQKMNAFKTGDVQAFQNADQRERELLQNQPQAAPQPQSEPAHVSSWKKQNEWFGTDPARTALADGLAQQVATEGYQGQALLQEVTRRVFDIMPMEAKPQTVPATQAFQAQPVGGAESTAPAPAKQSGISRLNAEAKEAFEEFYNDFGPSSGIGLYKSRDAAEKAFLDSYGD